MAPQSHCFPADSKVLAIRRRKRRSKYRSTLLATVPADNWDDFKAIERYSKTKMKASTFFQR
jgi:beta-lactamase regulating signal transducer with metallopeptidase domain